MKAWVHFTGIAVTGGRVLPWSMNRASTASA